MGGTEQDTQGTGAVRGLASARRGGMNLSATSAAYNPRPPARPTGYETPSDAQDNGWMGQVPPADPPVVPACPTRPGEPTYANPNMAPDPWLAPPLDGTDPTLFG
ncbi:MAG: hypothetical protein JWN72_229 [Thermoleophilia bacterium]|nr:hypothetical protein [Thermoleophilia bacterium]